MVYGDGAFKDPVGKIWELADPVVSPAYTAGLEGTPNEVKLKYLADNDSADLSGNELKDAYVLSTGERLEYSTLKCCEGDGMIEVELPENLRSQKNFCVCLELAEEEPIFESIKG